MILLDGRKARDARTGSLRQGLARLSRPPVLAILQVGDNPDSTLYIDQKKKFAEKIGALVQHIRFPDSVTFDVISDKVRHLNADPAIDGIIIQLPLPKSLDKGALIALIDPTKDVDGLTDENQSLLASGHPRFVPATARGVMSLLDFYGIDPRGMQATVIGRSRLVGSPVAASLVLRGAHVSVCHSQTPDTRTVTRGADLIVVAVGKPELIDASYVKQGVIVIDVGINSVAGPLDEEIPRRTLVGDVRFAEVAPIASAISPVPGGVGPMTVLSLFENLFDAARLKYGSK